VNGVMPSKAIRPLGNEPEEAQPDPVCTCDRSKKEMSFQPTDVRHRSVISKTSMTLVADSSEMPVQAELRYDSTDPFAVRMIFSVASSQPVEWVFSRELLIGGIRIPAGTGDVQIFPTHDGIVVELSSPAGRARLMADPNALDVFAEEMLEIVPLGSELHYFDLDAEIAMFADLELPGASHS